MTPTPTNSIPSRPRPRAKQPLRITPDDSAQQGPFVGTGRLLRFMLRRDRLRLPAWVVGITAMVGYFANVLGTVLDDKTIQSFASMATTPAMALIGGPAYGFEDITTAKLLVGLYGGFILIVAAVMGITTISRHTRVEEQSGRAELIRANVTGRHAALAASLILALLMSVAITVLVALAFHFSAAKPGSFNSSLLFAASIGAVGLVFAGLAAVTVQLSPYSRAASGMAGAILAATFVIRGLGDISFVQGGSLGWLSWLSPLGWSQQTAPLVLDRWWPLLISLGAAIALAIGGFALQSRRDLAAGILPDRLGSAVAPAWLTGAFSLSFRLQRSGIMWWSIALFLGGLTTGAFVKTMADNADGMPPEILAVFGGADGMVDGYLGFMGIYIAIFVGAFAILAIQTLRSEEQEFRAEPVLAAAVSRTAWLLSWVSVAGLAVLWLLAFAGLGTGLGAALSTGDWSHVGPVLLGHAVHAAAVWVLLGLAVALYGIVPRLLGLAWLAFGASAVLALFGDILQLDDAVLDASVFRHIGQYPAQDISWTAIAILTAIAAVLIAIGVARFRKRDLITA